MRLNEKLKQRLNQKVQVAFAIMYQSNEMVTATGTLREVGEDYLVMDEMDITQREITGESIILLRNIVSIS